MARRCRDLIKFVEEENQEYDEQERHARKDSCSVQVPIEWANFMTFALLSPDRFDWAKSLLSSQLWSYILEGSESNTFKSFVILDRCSSKQAPICQTTDGLEDTNRPATPPTVSLADKSIAATTSSAFISKKRKKGPLVETEVRRRVTELNMCIKVSRNNHVWTKIALVVAQCLPISLKNGEKSQCLFFF